MSRVPYLSGALFAVLLAVGAGGVAKEEERAPFAAKVDDLLMEFPLKTRGAPQVTPLAAGEGSSVALIQTVAPVRLHYHKSHDETVVVWRGKGKMRLGEKTHDVGPGSVLYIPRGTLHAFVPQGDEKAVVISTFSPPFDGKDRIHVPEEK